MICFCKSEMEIITINKNVFYRCPNCHYLKKINTVSLEKEKARYDMHVVDSGYEQYMKGVYDEIRPYINGDCIDYGCGKKHILWALPQFPFMPVSDVSISLPRIIHTLSLYIIPPSLIS